MHNCTLSFQTRFSLLKILVLALSFGVNGVRAQDFGNEWIDFNQTYYKLSVAETGIYRLTFDNLIDAGFPVDLVDPRRVQLFTGAWNRR